MLTDLLNEQLVATGYRERPSLSSAPVLIDAEHFYEGAADWAQSKFEANGSLWNRVKISAHEPPTVRKVPNSREAIDAAIHALVLRNNDFAKGPGKIRCDAVRAEIGKNYFSGSGLSDQNSKKRIVLIYGMKRINKSAN